LPSPRQQIDHFSQIHTFSLCVACVGNEIGSSFRAVFASHCLTNTGDKQNLLEVRVSGTAWTKEYGCDVLDDSSILNLRISINMPFHQHPLFSLVPLHYLPVYGGSEEQ
jgi:hypothetical protein